MLNGHRCIVFAIEHYNPLGIVRSLGREGIFPDVIAVKGKARVVSISKYVAKLHYVDTVEEGYRILMNEYGDCAPDELPIVFCSDDKTVGYLDLKYNEMRNRFIFFNAGAQGRINEYMDKYQILKCAERNGLKTLKAKVCKRGEVPGDLEYPVITKAISPNSGGWKADVFICNSEQELAEAYEHIRSEKVLVQKFIDKKNEYCLEGFSIDQGRQVCIAIASTYNYNIKGYYSPYMTVRNMTNETARKCLEGMFAEIGFEGLFEVEFLVGLDGELYFSEINFRNSPWSWASTVAGMNLPVLWGGGQLFQGKYPRGYTNPSRKTSSAWWNPSTMGSAWTRERSLPRNGLRILRLPA